MPTFLLFVAEADNKCHAELSTIVADDKPEHISELVSFLMQERFCKLVTDAGPTKPQDGLLVSQRSSTQSGSSGPQRAKGWMVRRGTLPIYPNHLNFKLPRGFNKRLALKLLVLTTQIPVACVGVLTNLGHALKFSPRALTRSRGWDAWLPWQELSPADSPAMAPPGTTLPPSLPAP